MSDLSRRDNRTQPGVLTPGIDEKGVPLQEGVRMSPFQSDVDPDKPSITHSLPSLQGGSMMGAVPGLKPQAESYCPFGTSPTSPASLKFATPKNPCGGAYLIAPMVNPRTNCRETMILKMITGRAIMVPVAMIWPQGKS
jgi:hypothetical protein